MRLKHLILLVFPVIAWLNGCTTLSSQVPAGNQTVSWEERSKELASITNWELKAAVGIHAGQSAESGSLQWTQNGGEYSLLMFGPLGANTFLLTGTPEQVELTTPQGKKLYAQSADVLLAKETGWNLPVSDLAYWIRGLPAPGSPAKKQLDAFNHITLLQQKGWKIQYLRYSSTNQIDLPTKILLEYPHLNVKIVINNWAIPHPG
jgi:outer membrane lipoprotein LolB